ncbi:MAG: bifunctional 2-keto-4-hydroxyglutarate aldolase/2-keto-3-deoxy-6-phosphogluconate aldolase [Clostridia bacterium]|nr:bifunctional 2-keto-4-hydroxyglutarate aldolase/2-keto-3-deoxy-6-phosphogluconate aldolase [Clostridia bacterium]MDE6211366.1 bifunctional 2-keto-4-hydroxyglutarate aldolase/2-keto-3-deoxy-6-phosphogluconate aldolase [Clostridia bacterium]MDE6604570.1 bifunctional 2-keto-4-hydroxyglutarate aldolase/2-keto-3-deoxy-6-phosphogluconate aldolase [Clostridia bacterium]
MKKYNVYQTIKEQGVVVVIRGNDLQEAIKTVEACYKGGIKVIEVTFTVPRADELIKTLVEKYAGSDMLVGAGTVLDPETARIAMLAGAQFIVSPSLNVDTIKTCNRYGVPVMSGVMTPTEAQTAMEYGVDILKLFPGDIAKPAGLKALKGPFPNANIMPTGGVSQDNVEEWFKVGAYAVGAGSFLTKDAKTGDFDKVEKTCRAFVEKVQSIIGGKK